MPDIETFHVESAIGAVSSLHDGVGRTHRSATGDAARPRRLSLRVPGRTPARPEDPDVPGGTGSTGTATTIARPPAFEADAAPGQPGQDSSRATETAGSLPAGPGDSADAITRSIFDAWQEDLDGLLTVLPPGERLSRFSRIEHARAAYLASRVPEAMLPAQVARHADFLAHEHAVAASFAQARAGEPGLTCNEWARRNPFAPVARPAAATTGRAPTDPAP